MGRKPIGESFAQAPPDRVEQTCGKCHLPDKTGAAAAAPVLNAKHWRRTSHARQGISCLTCHKAHGDSQHLLQKPPSELCRECHPQVINKSDGYTHRPVSEGQCLLCHTPHGGSARHNLLDKVSDACLSCHQPGAPGFVTAHSGYTVEKSDCLSCHNPHSFDRGRALLRKAEHAPFAARQCAVCHGQATADAKPALVKPVKELCLTCHPANTVMPTTGEGGKELVQHPPAQQGLCTQCHNPHASDRPKQMKDRTDYVCFSCHGGIEDATLSQYRHKPVTTGDCSLCHRGHTSPEKHLLNKESIALCNGCHTTQGKFSHPVGVWKGKPIRDPNTKQTLTCARCHAVHGSRFATLLPEDEDMLCRGCHKK
jgi:predicted CXXCH cytochrome family protein